MSLILADTPFEILKALSEIEGVGRLEKVTS
jgi:hypothetical protein